MIRLYGDGWRLRGVDTPKGLFSAAMLVAIREGRIIPSGVEFAFRLPRGRCVKVDGLGVDCAVARLAVRRGARLLLASPLGG